MTIEQQVAHVKCKQSLLFSTRYHFKNLNNRKYQVHGYINTIAEALEKVYRGEITKLTISVAPRLGKTKIAVQHFIAHGLELNPAAKFIHLTASDSLAHDNSEETKNIVKSAEYMEVNPHVRIKQDTDSRKKWYTTAGGGLYALSAGGQVTGFGAGIRDMEEAEFNEYLATCTFGISETFGGAIVIDDAIKPEDANSDLKREAVNRRYVSTIKNRRNSTKTPIIIIAQRVHKMDLIGYVNAIEPGEWVNVVIPELWFDDNNIPQCLDPKVRPVSELLAMRDSNEAEVRYIFQTQHQQNPQTREGLMFPLEDLKTYNPANFNPLEHAEVRYMYVDPADTGTDDLAAPQVALIGSDVYLFDVVYNKKGADYNQAVMIDKMTANKIDNVEFEGISAWKIMGVNLRNSLVQKGWEGEFRIIKSTTNKHTRINANHSWVKRHLYLRSDWAEIPEYRRFVENLTAYLIDQSKGGNAHDDAPDAMAGVAMYFQRNYGHLYTMGGG